MEKVRTFLKCFIFVTLGSSTARMLASYLHYRRYPGYYAMLSAPWYLEILAMLLVTAVVVAAAGLAYWLLGRKIRKRQQIQEKNGEMQ